MKTQSFGCCGRLAAASLLLVALAISPADASEPRAHDSGFFLRLSAGGGAGNTKADIGLMGDFVGPVRRKLEFSGATGDANFAIGALVTRNLAVHGTLFGWSATNPDVERGGVKYATSDVTLSLSCIGAGVTWYTEPSNFYLSGSVGAATLSAEYRGFSGESDTGVAVDLTAGKEWWVGNRWGLGVAAGVNLHSVPAGDDPDVLSDSWTGASFAVRFSATYD